MTKRTEEEKRSEYQDADWLREAAGWRWVTWRAPHPGWDHDHCVFCHAHFCDTADCRAARRFREGWRWDNPHEPGNDEMVCADCFDDLRDTFGWTVASDVPTGREPCARIMREDADEDETTGAVYASRPDSWYAFLWLTAGVLLIAGAIGLVMGAYRAWRRR